MRYFSCAIISNIKWHYTRNPSSSTSQEHKNGFKRFAHCAIIVVARPSRDRRSFSLYWISGCNAMQLCFIQYRSALSDQFIHTRCCQFSMCRTYIARLCSHLGIGSALRSTVFLLSVKFETCDKGPAIVEQNVRAMPTLMPNIMPDTTLSVKQHMLYE